MGLAVIFCYVGFSCAQCIADSSKAKKIVRTVRVARDTYNVIEVVFKLAKTRKLSIQNLLVEEALRFGFEFAVDKLEIKCGWCDEVSTFYRIKGCQSLQCKNKCDSGVLRVYRREPERVESAQLCIRHGSDTVDKGARVTIKVNDSELVTNQPLGLNSLDTYDITRLCDQEKNTILVYFLSGSKDFYAFEEMRVHVKTESSDSRRYARVEGGEIHHNFPAFAAVEGNIYAREPDHVLLGGSYQDELVVCGDFNIPEKLVELCDFEVCSKCEGRGWYPSVSGMHYSCYMCGGDGIVEPGDMGWDDR